MDTLLETPRAVTGLLKAGGVVRLVPISDETLTLEALIIASSTHGGLLGSTIRGVLAAFLRRSAATRAVVERTTKLLFLYQLMWGSPEAPRAPVLGPDRRVQPSLHQAHAKRTLAVITSLMPPCCAIARI